MLGKIAKLQCFICFYSMISTVFIICHNFLTNIAWFLKVLPRVFHIVLLIYRCRKCRMGQTYGPGNGKCGMICQFHFQLSACQFTVACTLQLSVLAHCCTRSYWLTLKPHWLCQELRFILNLIKSKSLMVV